MTLAIAIDSSRKLKLSCGEIFLKSSRETAVLSWTVHAAV